MPVINSLQRGSPALTVLLNRLYGQYDRALTDLQAGNTALTRLLMDAQTDRTINASGYITATTSFHRVDTNGAAAADNLDEIRGGAEGDILLLLSMSTARIVTCRHDIVNIWSNNGESFRLSATIPTIFRYNGTYWVRMSSTPKPGATPSRDFLYWRLTTSYAAYAALTENTLTWDAEDYDTAGWGAPGASVVLPIGYYLISAQHHWDNVAGVSCTLIITIDGDERSRQSVVSSEASFVQQTMCMFHSEAGSSTVSVIVYHDTGTVGRANTNYNSNVLSIEKIR